MTHDPNHMERLGVCVPTDLRKNVAAAAAKQGVTISNYVRIVLARHLAQIDVRDAA